MKGYVVYRYPSRGGKPEFVSLVNYDDREVGWTPFKEEAIVWGSYLVASTIVSLVGLNSFIELA